MKWLLIILTLGVLANSWQALRLRDAAEPNAKIERQVSIVSQAPPRGILPIVDSLPRETRAEIEQWVTSWSEGKIEPGATLDAIDFDALAQTYTTDAFFYCCTLLLDHDVNHQVLIKEMAKVEPVIAFQWFLTEPRHHEHPNFEHRLLFWWVQEQPEQAYAWYQDQRANPSISTKAKEWLERHSGEVHACLVGIDPEKAVEGLLKRTEQYNIGETELLGSLHTREQRMAFAKALGQQATNDRSLLSAGFRALSKGGRSLDEFKQAASYLPPTLDELPKLLGNAFLVFEETPGFLHWIKQAYGTEGQTSAAHAVSSPWISHNIEAALQWLTEQPPGPVKDAFIGSAVQRLASLDPDSALAWALTTEDSSMRHAAIGNVWYRWKELDENWAREGMQAAGLEYDETDERWIFP